MAETEFSETQNARRRLLANLVGVIVCDAGAEKARVVVAEGGDALTVPMHHDLHEAGQWSFAAARELDPAIELLLEPIAVNNSELAEPSEIDADRWMAFHGSTPPGCRLVSLAATFARFSDEDGRTHVAEGVLSANPLRSCLPGLCKVLNADRDRLADACERLAGVRPESPVAVGIDEWGVHVRAAFDVLRLEFETSAMDEATVRRVIGEVLDG
ncbi:MAG: hypothetical protein AAFV77_04250 [Planctomycetota bacterium]